jgi:anhydro-N-acetylmuramic acid kinase
VADAKVFSAIGVISGTSMDGIDVALIRTDGERVVATGPAMIVPYETGLRQRLIEVVADAALAEHDPLSALEADVTAAHVAAVERFLGDHDIAASDVDVVGMHGQTILHRPKQRFTRQLCDGGAAARRLGIDVVNRFRHADVAAGGEGAPLVPLYHLALVAGLAQPVMVLNLGGVGNVTYIDGGTVLAFDTGPASALIDDFVRRRRGMAYDANGALARLGTVNTAVLAQLMADPYFDVAPPKSLDRRAFHARGAVVDALSDADGAATLTAFTVEATVAALRHVPRVPMRWLVAGGGRLNAVIMDGLAQRLGVPVEPVERVNWNGDALEAECFGFLAVRSLLGLPISLPTTTGVPAAITGGELWRAGA